MQTRGLAHGLKGYNLTETMKRGGITYTASARGGYDGEELELPLKQEYCRGWTRALPRDE